MQNIFPALSFLTALVLCRAVLFRCDGSQDDKIKVDGAAIYVDATVTSVEPDTMSAITVLDVVAEVEVAVRNNGKESVIVIAAEVSSKHTSNRRKQCIFCQDPMLVSTFRPAMIVVTVMTKPGVCDPVVNPNS